MKKRRVLIRGLVVFTAMVATLFGLALPTKAIVGGEIADRPWTVSLQDLDPNTPIDHRCGGVLVAPQWVLTAAHCNTLNPPPTAPPGTPPLHVIVPGSKARIGSLQWNSGGTLATVDKVFLGPNYNGSAPANDIALIKLAQPVNNFPYFNMGKIGPAGSQAIVAGWGTTCDADPGDPACRLAIPTNLQQLTERRLSDDEPNNECSLRDEGRELFDRATMFCMVSADGQLKQACNADSGSPVMQRSPFGDWRVVGVVVGDGDEPTSRAQGCTTTRYGTQGKILLMDVGAYSLWIGDTMRNN